METLYKIALSCFDNKMITTNDYYYMLSHGFKRWSKLAVYSIRRHEIEINNSEIRFSVSFEQSSFSNEIDD